MWVLSNLISRSLGTYMRGQIVEKKPKTNVWEITSTHHGNVLGVVKWYGSWRQYCFFPESNCLFNHACLFEVFSFLIKLNDEHKEKRRKEKACGVAKQ